MLRRLLALVIATVMVFPPVTFATELSSACAPNLAVVTAQLSKSSLVVDETLSVTVNASEMTDVMGVDIWLSYDPSLLQIVDENFTTSPVFKFPQQFIDPQAGTVNYGGASSTAVSGSALLFTIEFKAIAIGLATIGLTKIVIVDPDAVECTLPLPASPKVSVLPSLTVEPLPTIISTSALAVTGVINDPAISDVHVVVDPPQGYTPVSGDAATINDGGSLRTFAKTVTLTEGSNPITIYGGPAPITASVILDTIPPDINITGVASNAMINSSITPVINVTDANPDSSSATIQLGEGAAQGFTSGTTIEAEGSYTLAVHAKDLAGNTANQNLAFTIDKTAPVISITGVSNAAVTKDPVTPNFSATDTYLHSVTAQIQLNADPFVPFLTGTTLSAEGIYTLNVLASDQAGNTSTQGLFFAIDLTAPVITIVGVQADALVAGTVTPTFSALDDNLQSVTATLKLGDGDPVAFTSGTSVAQDGAYTLNVVATDMAGNAASAGRSFTIDNTVPVISIGGVQDGEMTKNAVTPTYSANDLNLDTVAATIKLGENDPVAFASGTELTAEGTYTLSVEATDLAGNIATQSITFTIDTTPPGVSIDGTAGPFFTNLGTYLVTGTTSGGATMVQIEVLMDGDSESTVTEASLSDGAFAATVVLPTDGSYSIKAIAYDQATNSAVSSPINVVRDQVVPSLAVSSPTDGQQMHAVTVTGTVADDRSGLDSVTVNGVAVQVSAGSFSTVVTLVNPTEGSTHLITVVATDKAGNEETLQRSIIYTEAVVPLTITVPAPTQVVGNAYYSNQQQVALTGTVAIGATLSLSVNGAAAVPIAVDGAGAWAETIILNLNASNSVLLTAADGVLLDNLRELTIYHDDVAPDLGLIVNITRDGAVRDQSLPLKAGDLVTVALSANETLHNDISLLLISNSPILVELEPDAGQIRKVSFSIGAEMSGPISIEFAAADLAGNTSSQQLSLTADTIKPEFVVPGDSTVAATTYPVSLVVTDNLAVASVLVSGQAANLVDGAWALTVDLNEGPNTITIMAIDTAGNSETQSYTVTRDMTGPVIDTTNIVPALGGITGSGRPNFQIPVSDAFSNINLASASLSLSVAQPEQTPVVVEVALTSQGSGKSLTLLGQPDADLVPEEGQATVTATLVLADALGNTTTLTTWNFTLNRKIPLVAANSNLVANLAGWTNQVPTITLTASAASTEIRYALVTRGAGSPGQLSIYDSQTKFTVPEGQWDLWAFATDLETGLFGDAQLVASYNVDTTVPIAAGALVVTPAETQWVKAGIVTLGFTVAEAGLQAVYSLAYDKKGQDGTFAPATPLTGTFASQENSYTASFEIGADAGEWRNLVVTVSLTDLADNTVFTPFTLGFSVDTIAPVVTAVTHSAERPLREGETLTVTVVAESGLAATTQVKLVSTGDPVVLTVTESPVNLGTYTATYLVQDGDNRVVSISVNQTDLAGNLSESVSAVSTVKLDTTPPVLTSTAIFDAIQGQTSDSVSHYRAGDLVKLRLIAEAGLIGNPAFLATAHFSIPGITGATEVALVEVADGVYEGEYLVVANDNTLNAQSKPAPVVLSVFARDAAGNTATLVGQEQILIDTTAPVVTAKGHNAPAILTVGDTLQIGLSSEAKLRSVSYSLMTGRGQQSGLMTASTSVPEYYQAAYSVQAGDDVAAAVITLVLTDWAGNVTTTTIDRTVNIVTTPPTVGQVTLVASRPDSQIEPAVLRVGDTLQITFTGDLGLQAYVSLPNLVTNVAMTESAGTYSLTLPIQAGMNLIDAEVTIKAVNAAGLLTTRAAETLINIDTLPPAASASFSHNPDGLAGWYVTAPTLTIALEAGSTLTLKNGEVAIALGTASTTNGIETYTWLMPEGIYSNLTYQAVDAAGNLGDLVVLPVVKIDTTPPAPPSGISAPTDSAAAVSVEGTVQVGSGELQTTRVALYVNGFFREVGSVSNNAFLFPSVRLDEDLKSGGSNSIALRAIDQAGNQSALSAAITVERDSTPPSFRIEVAQGGGGAGTVTVTASETLADGISTTGSTPDLTLTGVNGNVYSFSYTGLTGTAIRIRASGTDLAGNQGSAHLVEARVNAQLGGTVSSFDGEVTATFGPGALAGIGDVDVIIRPVLVQSITNNRISKGTQILGNPYDFQATLTAGQGVSVTFKLNVTGFQDHQIGFYYFPDNDDDQPEFVLGTVTNRVTQGNVTTATVTATLPHFSIWAPGGDTIPPDFVGGLTINGQVDAATGPTVKTSSIVITGQVDSSAQTVRARVDGGAWVNGTLAAAGADQSFSITLPIGSLEGAKTIAVEALDQVQNASSQSFTVTLDTTAPTVSATVNGATPAGMTFTTGSLVAIAASSPGGLITVKQGDTVLVQDASNSVNLSVALDSNTTSTITVTARDQAIGATAQDQGNVSAAQTITIRRDNAAPEIAVSGLAPTTTVTGSTSLSIGYSITQLVGGTSTAEDVQSVTVALDGVQVFTGAAASYSAITLNFSTAATYTVTVTAVDRAGNNSVATRTVLYDPSAPAVVVSAPALLTNQNTAVVTISHQTGTEPFAGAAVQVTQGATVVNGTASTDSTFVYHASLVEGDNEIQVSVTGANAFTGTGSITIRYDATPPTGTLQAPAATTSTAGMTMTADLTSEPAHIQIQRLVGSTWTDIGTQTALLTVGSHSVGVTLVAGAQQYRAKLTDAAGNIGYSTAVSVTYNVPQGSTPLSTPTPVVLDPTLTANVAKEQTRESNVMITGTVTGAIEVEILRGSTVLATVPVVDGAFQFTAPLIEGANSFTLVVRNSEGTRATTTVEVHRDSTPPSLVVTVGTRISRSPSLSVTVNSERDATVTVNGVMQGKIDLSGHLTFTLDLLEGLNRFEISATDVLGNISPVQVIEANRTLPRQATLTLGFAPQTTDQQSIPLTGWANPEATYTISQNGTVVRQGTVGPVGRFVTSVDLLQGTNSITVQIAIDGTLIEGSLIVNRLMPVRLSDLPGHWADAAVTELVAAGVIDGYEDGSFRPEGTLTRAEFAKMIVTALNLPIAPASELRANDADQIPNWAKGYVATAIKAGLITGFEDGSFRADQEITRIQIVVIMSRALSIKGVSLDGLGRQFTDQASVPSWAVPELNRVSQAGLISGFEDGSLRPSTSATRAQAAVLTLRLMKVR